MILMIVMKLLKSINQLSFDLLPFHISILNQSLNSKVYSLCFNILYIFLLLSDVQSVIGLIAILLPLLNF